jgi:hypothetical protein
VVGIDVLGREAHAGFDAGGFPSRGGTIAIVVAAPVLVLVSATSILLVVGFAD